MTSCNRNWSSGGSHEGIDVWRSGAGRVNLETEITMQQGIAIEKAREIVKLVKIPRRRRSFDSRRLVRITVKIETRYRT